MNRIRQWIADLQDADLSGVDLREVDLHHAVSLEHMKLHGARGMPEWISQGIDDSGRYTQARLSEAITQGFKNLSKANLYKIYLREVDLSGADLSGADLSGAHLERTVLHDADLSGAGMERTDLGKADLRRACLRGAHLRKTFLVEADLREADLCGARLERADLIQTNMSHANITGVNLYGSARDDWIISGIQCEYVYWDLKPYFKDKEQEQQWEQEHLVLKNRDFRPGEFEELYKHLPTFEYYFEHGFTPIDAVVMDQVVQGINKRHPEFSLRLKNFEATGTPHATCRGHRAVKRDNVKHQGRIHCMISLCDGCGQFLKNTLTTLNAKEWNPNVCRVSVENSYHCNMITCPYNVEGDCCIEFQFCDTCFPKKSIVNKKFEGVESI